ncbi:MAG: glucose-1-phosphate thymidylyltransferase [Candidatus Fischerbacteria bacterium RBG_13_37_8]|uniref:Glucose-1-phosphate thymidylyltransferase n=1 Tax=Candidatus Fischerbacteria bacterium RBG_13_37_8 TaxID=1817863 RepID=A0A1F5VH14_9BACT|nr:MAG: glucose-1-phosphate thymidylyltransferase [Candidatus Fischerbacteria bacterium RBG_13_37_8]
MKGLILSGGKGTRLRPITYTSAKQLIPIANKPVLFYVLEDVSRAGIKDVGIIVGDSAKEIMDAVGDGQKWNLNITYIQQNEPLGLAHTVMISEKFLRGSPFVMYLGDNLLKEGISSFVNNFDSSQAQAMILLAEVNNPQEFGVAELKNGKVVRLIEKPQNPPSNYALVGIYLFTDIIFDAVKQLKPSWRNEYEITDAIQYLIDKGFTVEPHIVKSYWKDTGKLEDILEANRLILEDIASDIQGSIDEKSTIIGKVCIGTGAKIISSTIRGPAIIGENAYIKNSFIGPFTSIGNATQIINSEIENSILMSHSKIIRLRKRIEDSLIGKGVEIKRETKPPKAYRFMIGDHSQIGIY